MFKKEIYKSRRKELLNRMGSGIILLIGNDESSINFPDNWYRFRQDSTFLYYVGINKPGMMACFDVDSGEEWLVGDDIDIDTIIWMGNQPNMKEMADSTSINGVMSPSECSEFLQKRLNSRELHILPPYRRGHRNRYKKLLQMGWEDLENKVSSELISAVAEQRNHKSEEEIAEMHRAANITGQMHLSAMQYARPGMKEAEVAGFINGIAVSGGGDLSFPIILTKNGQILHNHYHGNTLSEGDLLLVDCGAETDMGYAGDMTRTFPVSSSFSSRQKDIYEIVLAAENNSIDMLKPGVPYRDVHLTAGRIIAEGLKNLGLLNGDPDDIVQEGAHALFMPHGLGHMIGLDVHDMENLGEDVVGYTNDFLRSPQFGLKSLRLGRPLEEGFALTVEPGIYFIPELIRQWKVDNKHTQLINFDALESWYDFGGIRIEEDYLITANGAELLGEPVAKSVKDVEEIRKEVLA